MSSHSGTPKFPCCILAKEGQIDDIQPIATPFWPAIMNEIIFLVEEASEGGLTARALGESIFTEADTMEELRQQVRDAVKCHYEEGQSPGVIRLHFVREEVLAG